MKGRMIALFLFAAVLALGICYPYELLRHSDLSFVKGWIGQKRLEYKGELSVWHVPGSGMGMGDGSSFLAARAKEFERKNFGIYLTIETMDEAELQKRLHRGEAPDILSFPAGSLETPENMLSVLHTKELPIEEALLKTGCVGKDCYAIPYYYGGGALVVNDDLLYAGTLMPPGGIPDGQWLADAMASDGFSLVRMGEHSELFALASPLDDAAADLFLTAPVGTPTAFLKGEAQMALMDLKTLYAIKQRENTGHIPSLSIYGMGASLYSAQYMGLSKDLNEEKWAAAEAFITVVLSESSQQRLLEYWCYPVRTGVEDYIPEDIRMASLWESIKGEKARGFTAFTQGGVEETVLELVQQKEGAAALRRRGYGT